MINDVGKPSDVYMKKYIIEESKDLDKSDCIDILTILITKIDNYNSVLKTTSTGTYIYLNKLNKEVLEIIYNMVYSKIQRIKDT